MHLTQAAATGPRAVAKARPAVSRTQRRPYQLPAAAGLPALRTARRVGPASWQNALAQLRDPLPPGSSRCRARPRNDPLERGCQEPNWEADGLPGTRLPKGHPQLQHPSFTSPALGKEGPASGTRGEAVRAPASLAVTWGGQETRPQTSNMASGAARPWSQAGLSHVPAGSRQGPACKQGDRRRRQPGAQKPTAG